MARSYRPSIECLEDRIAPATYGIAWPNPQQLTLSFVPDGTQVTSSSRSSLFQTLDAQQPTAQWELAVLRAFQTWAVNANVNIGLVKDAGLPLGAAGAPQGDPRFGDIRIATAPLASDVVAFSEPYSPLAGTWAGDVELNPAYFGKGSAYDVFSVLLHEAGHVFGFPDNPSDPASVMFEDFLGVRAGISAGDVALLQSLYGPPPLDSDAGTVTTINSGHSSFNGDLSTLQDVDTYQYKATGNGGSFTITLHTAGVSLLVPKVTVYDSNGNVVATEANQTPLDGDLAPITITADKTSTYTIVVQGATGDVFGMGSYQLEVDTDKTANGSGNGNQGGNHSQSPVTALQAKTYRTDGRFAYAAQGNIASAAQVNWYQFQSPSPTDGLPNVMTVSVWGTQPNGFQPLVTLEDIHGNPVPVQVLVNQDGTYTFQLPDAAHGSPYLLAVQAEGPNGAHATGNYFLGIGFGTQPIQLNTFAANQEVGTLHILQSQLFHLNFSASGGAGQMTIYDDAQGSVLDTLTANSGETVTANLVLQPGLYSVRFAPAPGETAPVTYSFSGQGVSDPIGPQPLDTTLDPGPTATTGLAYWWQAGYSAFLGVLAAAPGGPTNTIPGSGPPGTGPAGSTSSSASGGPSSTPGGPGGGNAGTPTNSPGLGSTNSGTTVSSSTGPAIAGTVGSNFPTAGGSSAGPNMGGPASNNLAGVPLGSSSGSSAPSSGPGAAPTAAGTANNSGLATVLSTAAKGASPGAVGADFTGGEGPADASGTIAALQWVVRINNGFGPFLRQLAPSQMAATIPPDAVPPFLPAGRASDAGETGNNDALPLPVLPPLSPNAVARGRWFASRVGAEPDGASAPNLAWLYGCLLLSLGVYPLVRKFGRKPGADARTKDLSLPGRGEGG